MNHWRANHDVDTWFVAPPEGNKTFRNGIMKSSQEGVLRLTILGAASPAVLCLAKALPQQGRLTPATYPPQQVAAGHSAPLVGLVQGPDSRTSPLHMRVSMRLKPWFWFRSVSANSFCLASKPALFPVAHVKEPKSARRGSVDADVDLISSFAL